MPYIVKLETHLYYSRTNYGRPHRTLKKFKDGSIKWNVKKTSILADAKRFSRLYDAVIIASDMKHEHLSPEIIELIDDAETSA